MDSFSAIIMPFARAFWGFVSLCMLCSGLGGALAGIALWYGGEWSGLWLVIWLFGCAALTWLAAPTRQRYRP